MAKGIEVKIDNGKVNTVVGGHTQDAARRAAELCAMRAENNIRGAGRIDTGEMIGGITIDEVTGHPLMAQFRIVSTAPHSAYNEFGTRAHGPRRAPFMVFTPKTSSRVVFAKWVRGIEGIHFMQRAVDSVRVSDYYG